MALEDKMSADALWDAVGIPQRPWTWRGVIRRGVGWRGIPRAPMELVAAREPELEAAHVRQQTASGSVWTGDAKQGWHGWGDTYALRLRPGQPVCRHRVLQRALRPGSRDAVSGEGTRAASTAWSDALAQPGPRE